MGGLKHNTVMWADFGDPHTGKHLDSQTGHLLQSSLKYLIKQYGKADHVDPPLLKSTDNSDTSFASRADVIEDEGAISWLDKRKVDARKYGDVATTGGEGADFFSVNVFPGGGNVLVFARTMEAGTVPQL